MSKIEIEVAEAKQVFFLIEKLQQFLHQPMNYETKEDFRQFVKDVYPDIHEAYYEIVWNWLPTDIQAELEER